MEGCEGFPNREATQECSISESSQISALFRPCTLLDDLPQTAVRSVLRRILRFRQRATLHGPRLRPLVLPLLAHDSLQKSVEQWISGLIFASKDYIDYMTQFHMSHKKCVAGKHRSLRDVIYNASALAELWASRGREGFGETE